MKVWLFNIDAEFELFGATKYENKALVSRFAGKVARSLVKKGDVWLGESDEYLDGDGRVVGPTPTELRHATGLPWCATPSAVERFRRLGIRVPERQCSDVEVLRRVNDRRFMLKDEVDARWPRAWCADEAAFVAHAAAHPSIERWRLKRRFTVAGKGHATVHDLYELGNVRGWMKNAAEGFLAEPEVEVVSEWVVDGFVDRDRVLLSKARRARMRPSFGPSLDTQQEDEVLEAARGAGRLLQAARYEGPFGIDAFLYRRDDRVLLQPRSELNARFTVGWSLALDPFAHSQANP